MKPLLAFVALFFAASGLWSVADTADARNHLRAKKKQSNDSTSTARARGTSHDAARVSGSDPAGNYKNFPDWARNAFGGRNPSSR